MKTLNQAETIPHCLNNQFPKQIFEANRMDSCVHAVFLFSDHKADTLSRATARQSEALSERYTKRR